MLKPTTKYKPEIPNAQSLLRMTPEKQVFELGLTPLNLVTLLNYTKTSFDEINKVTGMKRTEFLSIINLEREIDYLDFEVLCKHMQTKMPKDEWLREVVPELGYSPYNLAVLQKDLSLIQSKFSELLGWSTPKLRQHIPSSTSSSQFSQMSIGNWVYVCETYLKVLRKSDKKFKLTRDYKAPFLGSNKALAKPTLPKYLNYHEDI